MERSKNIKYPVKDLKFVSIIGPGTEHFGYAFVIVKGNRCKNIFGGKEYTYITNLDLNKTNITKKIALETKHSMVNDESLRKHDVDYYSRSSIISFVLEKGTDESGTLYFYGCNKGELVKEYGTYWS